MRPVGVREEMPSGTLRVDSKPQSRLEVKREGAAVWVEGLADRATPLGLRSTRMQRICERICEVGLSAPGGQAADAESA
jgi:hypothetical protein